MTQYHYVDENGHDVDIPDDQIGDIAQAATVLISLINTILGGFL